MVLVLEILLVAYPTFRKLGNRRSSEGLGSGFWYCKAECGLCSGAVLNDHKAVQCDKCKMWVHNDCSFVTDLQYETMQNSSLQDVHVPGFVQNVIFSTSQTRSFLSS